MVMKTDPGGFLHLLERGGKSGINSLSVTLVYTTLAAQNLTCLVDSWILRAAVVSAANPIFYGNEAAIFQVLMHQFCKDTVKCFAVSLCTLLSSNYVVGADNSL